MSAPTPGPWQSIFVGDGIHHASIICASDPVGTPAKDIAAVWDRGGAKKAEANARLIAAAPELLAALQALLRRDERNTCTHQETHRGGAIWEICDECGLNWADDRGGKPKWEDPAEWQAARAAIAKATGEQA
jgi:hypothetical protein